MLELEEDDQILDFRDTDDDDVLEFGRFDDLQDTEIDPVEPIEQLEIQTLEDTIDEEYDILDVFTDEELEDKVSEIEFCHKYLSKHDNPEKAFEKSEKIVIVGQMKEDYFAASQILMKCPSKYVKEPDQ